MLLFSVTAFSGIAPYLSYMWLKSARSDSFYTQYGRWKVMKKTMLFGLAVLALVSVFCSPVLAQYDRIVLQNIYQIDSQKYVTAEYIVVGGTWITTVSIINVADGSKSSTVVGNDIYINDVVALDNRKLLLISTSGNWAQSLLILMDVEYPDWFSKLSLGDFEYLADYWTTGFGVYFTSRQYTIGSDKATQYVKFWDYYSNSPTKISKFGENAWMVFGWAGSVNPNGPALMALQGIKGSYTARCFRIDGTKLVLLKTVRIPRTASDPGLYVGTDNDVLTWWDVTYYK